MESTLLTEAGDLIIGLTEDVQQLQQENTLVQLSVDSLTEENFLLSDTIASLERAAESAARVSADEMDDLKAVNGSLLNKVHKLESLLALEDTKNKDLRDQLEDKLHELKLVVQEDKDNANIHVREVEVLRKVSLRLKSLFLYTVGILYHAEWCIRQLWCSSIILYNITSISYHH